MQRRWVTVWRTLPVTCIFTNFFSLICTNFHNQTEAKMQKMFNEANCDLLRVFKDNRATKKRKVSLNSTSSFSRQEDSNASFEFEPIPLDQSISQSCLSSFPIFSFWDDDANLTSASHPILLLKANQVAFVSTLSQVLNFRSSRSARSIAPNEIWELGSPLISPYSTKQRIPNNKACSFSKIPIWSRLWSCDCNANFS